MHFDDFLLPKEFHELYWPTFYALQFNKMYLNRLSSIWEFKNYLNSCSLRSSQINFDGKVEGLKFAFMLCHNLTKKFVEF